MDPAESKNIAQGRMKRMQMETASVVWKKALSILENSNN